MFVIHGAYHFWPKRVAFRNDYCFTCGQACRAVAIRTFDVGHIFWIPILPVGSRNIGSAPSAVETRIHA